MAKPPCAQPTNTGYGRFIGRVGGLAVALGIGVAIANNPGIASADDGQAPAKEKTSATSESPDSGPSTPDSNPVKTAVKQLHSRFAEARENCAESTRDPSAADYRPVDRSERRPSRRTCKPRRS